LLLEDESGGTDQIDAEGLAELLAPAGERLKLLILDACYTGAASHAEARRQVGLDRLPVRASGAPGAAVAGAPTVLPSLAQELSGRLDCAAVAMRYPVGDAFATELMLSLYGKLLDKHRPLPEALHLALSETLERDTARPILSSVTPILVGRRAAELKLVPPRATADFALPRTGLGIGFPAEPERFVGRMLPMLRATQALAPRSAPRGVLFHGMPGAGKTACALELAYRHAQGRFQGFVWYRAPESGTDISNEIFNLLFEIERQLDSPDLGLTTALADPARFRRFTLPRLRAMLEQQAVLLVLDNLETLLTESNQWRDPLWSEVVGALLGHGGTSRVVLTSRRVPVGLADNALVRVESIHALSFGESVLLARQMPHLRALFGDEAGQALLRETLRVVQGHPKLLELADRLAADREALARRVAGAADEWGERAATLDAFLAVGGDREGETRQGDAEFVRALQGWTAGVTAGLSPTARLLFAFLCRLEPADRVQRIVQANWKDFLNRLGQDHPVAVSALTEPGEGLPAGLEELAAVGLIEVEKPELGTDTEAAAALVHTAQTTHGASADGPTLQALLAQAGEQATTYGIHPGVAETVRGAADPAVLAAADIELGSFHAAMSMRALEREMQGGGAVVAPAARRAAPYLMRQARWAEAATLVERMLERDRSPATLAFALPLVRHIAAATRGTGRELKDAALLGRCLWLAGRTDEAEALLLHVIERAVAAGDYRAAGGTATDLINSYRQSGRLSEALAFAETAAEYTRQAGLGPWRQLADEGTRLQVLAEMGRYDEVLATVEKLRPRLDELPLEAGEGDPAWPWQVREVVLDAARTAALGTGRWETALALNAQILAWQRARAADALELAETSFNDYGPLLSLQRYSDARALLQSCRRVFEQERVAEGLGRVYSALGDLEETTGDRGAAVRFEQVALRYKYQAGSPEDCAISHHNLSNYLRRQGADAGLVLAHRVAAAVIRVQTQSGPLPNTIRNLAVAGMPPLPPSFAEVVARVEEVEGVRFAALFDRLPRTEPDGDAALGAVWRLVAEERARQAALARRRDGALAAVPPEVRAAIEAEDVPGLQAALAKLPPEQRQAIVRQLEEAGVIGVADGGRDEARQAALASVPPDVRAAIEAGDVAALQAALDKLPPDSRQAIVRQLQESGVIGISGRDVTEVLRQFGPLLSDIAQAVSDHGLRPKIEAALAQLEGKGWHLTDAVHRVWSGERDHESLTAGLDEQDTALVRRILELLGDGGRAATQGT
ncbi:MAG: hypothetical protein AB1505_31260, partial [Candidatus Latescibacterota bacterium]